VRKEKNKKNVSRGLMSDLRETLDNELFTNNLILKI